MSAPANYAGQNVRSLAPRSALHSSDERILYPSGGIRPNHDVAEFAARCVAFLFFGVFALALVFGPHIAAAIILLCG